MCVFEIFLKQFNTLKQKEQKKLYETFWDHKKKLLRMCKRWLQTQLKPSYTNIDEIDFAWKYLYF